jgi:hypothetical protein
VVCKQYFGVEQGKQTVDEYYNQFVAICKERNLYQLPSMDLKKREKQHQDVNVVWFLLGEKPEVDLVHAQILGGSNLPSLLEVFPWIQRATLFYHSSQLSFEHTSEHSTFISSHGSFGCSRGGRGGQCGRDSQSSGRTGSHEPYKCTHCGHSNQSVHFCWDLYNEPSSFANQAFSLEDYLAIFGPPASSSPAPHYDLISILKDEYAQFLIHKWATFSSTATLAQSGSASHFLSSPTREPWIIDFGANEHMTGTSTSPSDYHPVDSAHTVTLANGSLSTMAGSGHTHVSLDIELLSVLQVPSFPFNLLSISKITKALNCFVSYFFCF